ncbi:hypothetical protein PT974_04896 [Cladobotryum mycophilum]|uniref:Uncharacterized protein n=1 Tax=Cladobotryum mycophilum TaxID=491253 RepID=A0ABR0SQH5_9HYPO
MPFYISGIDHNHIITIPNNKPPESPHHDHLPFKDTEHQRRDSADSLHGQVSTTTAIGLTIGLGLIAIIIGTFFYFRYFSPPQPHQKLKPSRSSSKSRSKSRSRSAHRSGRFGGGQSERRPEESPEKYAPASDPLPTPPPVFPPRHRDNQYRQEDEYDSDMSHTPRQNSRMAELIPVTDVHDPPAYQNQVFNPMDAPQLNDQDVWIHPVVAAAQEAEMREAHRQIVIAELVGDMLASTNNRREGRRMRHYRRRRSSRGGF